MSMPELTNSTDDPLAAAVDAIVQEEVSALQERRSAHRAPLVRPVTIQIGRGEPLFGFSKNISDNGIGVIMNTPPPSGSSALLSIQSLKGKPVVLRSELRWCEPFGTGWYVTGWKFLAEIRG
jgi:hypothetical protein